MSLTKTDEALRVHDQQLLANATSQLLEMATEVDNLKEKLQQVEETSSGLEQVAPL